MPLAPAPQQNWNWFQKPAQNTQPSIPNMGAIGNINGTGEPLMPQGLPDYIGQAGNLFNNFQPYNLGNTPDLSGAMSGFDSLRQRAAQPGPQIPVGDVITGQQQNQMLNSAIGANANQRQSAMRDAMQNFGSRGFTSESPALQGTSNRLGLNEALANTQARVDIPMRAAQTNAAHRLQAMQANQAQRSSDIQNMLGVENAATGRISPLLSSLVAMV